LAKTPSFAGVRAGAVVRGDGGVVRRPERGLASGEEAVVDRAVMTHWRSSRVRCRGWGPSCEESSSSSEEEASKASARFLSASETRGCDSRADSEV